MFARLARRIAPLRRSVPAAALSLALAGAALVPEPARADDDDVRRALAALAALGIIAYAIDRADDDDRTVAPHRPHRPVIQPPRPHRPIVEPPRGRDPHRPRAGFLPVECVRSNGTPSHLFGTRNDRRVVVQRCLRYSNVRIGTLPEQCRGTARLRAGQQPVFGFACLRQQGYRFR